LIQLSETETVYSRAISILSKFDIDEFIITTGYLENVLKEYTKNKFQNDDINFTFVYNPVYDKTNYIKSLDLIPTLDDDIILLHGDLIFNHKTANEIIKAKETSVIIDSTIPLPKEDFKAKISNNLVKHISVDYFEKDAVACQPLYKLTNEDWEIWKDKIKAFCLEGKTNVYAENALNTITDKITLHPLDIKGELCMEIDTKEDLIKAKEILNK
jgi:phosphoenolpyruvate phosphomutase